MEGNEGLLLAVWRSKLYHILLLMFILCAGLMALLPNMPTILTNFFASRASGRDTDCQGVSGPSASRPCRDAHAAVVQWTSLTSFLANSVFSFVLSPLVGDLSDRYGRKPFFVIGIAIQLLPASAVVLALRRQLSLVWYFPMNALSGLVSFLTVFMACVADLLPPQHRTSGFGLIIASFASGLIVGPLIGGLVPSLTAAYISLACTSACVLYAVVLIPETLPAKAEHEGSGACRPPQPPAHVFVGVVKCWRIITQNALFMKLAAIMCIVGVVSEGVQDFLIQYLQLTCGFTTVDQSRLFVLLGVSNLLMQAVLLSWLVRLFGDKRLLVVGLLMSGVEHVYLAVNRAKWGAFAAVAIGSLGNVAWPTIASIKANNSPRSQQGVVQGALAGIRALAQGLGPVIFAQIFSLLTVTDSPLGYHPSALFLIPAIMTFAAVVVAATIKLPTRRKAQVDSERTRTIKSNEGSIVEVEEPLLADIEAHVTFAPPPVPEVLLEEDAAYEASLPTPSADHVRTLSDVDLKKPNVYVTL